MQFMTLKMKGNHELTNVGLLERLERQEIDSSPQLPEGMQAFLHHNFSPVRILTSSTVRQSGYIFIYGL